MIAVIILLEEFLEHRGRGDRQPQRYYIFMAGSYTAVHVILHSCL